MMDKSTAEKILQALQKLGYAISTGLSSEELQAIERVYDAPLPPDFRLFLSIGVPTGERGSFPDWHGDVQFIHDDCQAAIASSFEFDVEENDYWHPLFGDKPDDLQASKQKAAAAVLSWPPLIRVYAHRYIPTQPGEAGNPVISVWQPTDSIIYGNNLTHYLMNEFKLKLDVEEPDEAKEVPYWSAAFALEG